MTSTKGFNKQRLVFGIYLLVLIVLIEVGLHSLHLPNWPVFMIMIFFFESHMNTARAPRLIVGAVVGICCYMLTVQFVELTISALGLQASRLIVICTVVYAIVAFGEILPMVFNNYAFMFYLVSGLAARLEGSAPQPLIWLAMAFVGGVAVIAAILLIQRLVMLTFGLTAKGAPPQSESPH